MGKIRRGWEMTKKSWTVLRGHPALLRFPLFAALAALIVLTVVVLPGLYLIDSNTSTVGGWALTGVGLYLAFFISYFFSVGLAATADEIFRGNQATMSGGLKVARSRVGAIAGWALVAVLVGALFSVIENIKNVGPIIANLMNTAWGLISFLAVPVIAIEGTGPIATVKRSATLFKSRWPGQVTGNFAIGGIVFVVGLLPAIGLVVGGGYLWASDGNGADIAIGATLVALGIALGVVSLLIMRALSGIFGVALYRFTADGTATGGFSAQELESAVTAR